MASGKLPGSFPIPDLEIDLVKPLRIRPKHASDLTLRTPNLSSLLSGDISEQEQTKVDLLALTLSLLDKFSKLHTSVDGYVEIFNPILEILDALKFGKLALPLQVGELFAPGPAIQTDVLQKTQHAKLRDALKKTLAFALQARRPLLLQAHKPIPIASYIPKFDTGRYDRRNDPDFERNAASKLKAMYKKEKKGAIRELRKDNRFLAEEQMKRQEEVDKGYKARITRAVGEIQTERHEQKQMEKEKMREKRRSGK